MSSPRFKGSKSTATRRRVSSVGRIVLAGVLMSACAIGVARAEPEDDMMKQAELAGRFDPFDKAAGAEWAPAFPTPFYRKAPAEGPEAVPLRLSPGAYMIVVLCDCANMDVTLLAPGGARIEPVRKNEQGAMYSLDAPAAGDYLAGIDMGECGEKTCDLAVKVYRKKK